MRNSRLYEHDFYAWANEQAALLRAGRLSEADIAHVAEEIESRGKAEKRELVSRLKVLLLHLLKWQFQPTMRGTSWRLDHLDDNPSLRATLPESIRAAYRLACIIASRETGLAEETFPANCPWSFEQMTADDFRPDEVT